MHYTILKASPDADRQNILAVVEFRASLASDPVLATDTIVSLISGGQAGAVAAITAYAAILSSRLTRDTSSKTLITTLNGLTGTT